MAPLLTPTPEHDGQPPAGSSSDTVRFAALVRAVASEARRLGLQVPGFRSPPRLGGVDRSVRRRPGTSPSVAVRLAGRSDRAVAADLVEGVIVANELTVAAATHVRQRLLAVVPLARRVAA